MGEVLDLGVLCGFVEKSGAWYAYKGDKIGQGKANAAKFLEDNPQVSQTIEKDIRNHMLSSSLPLPSASEEAELEDA